MSRPTRKSLEERSIFGRKDRATVNESNIIKVTTLPIPESIARSDEKTSLWNFLTADLAKRQLLAESYIWVMEMLIENIFALKELREQLETTGYITPVFGKDGDTVVRYEENPLFSMVKRTETVVIKLLEKLGLTPRDIVYLNNPDAKIQIEQVVEDTKKVSYFR